MRLVYPPEGHSTFEKSSFLLGSVLPGSTLTVNGEAIPVSSRGFFALSVRLQPGDNRFDCTERQADGTTLREVCTVCHEPPLSFQTLPDSAEPFQPFVIPQEEMGVLPGETLVVACPAPPDAKVTCRIEGIMSRAVDMHPSLHPPDNREGVFAELHHLESPWPEASVYMAYVHIPLNTPPLSHLPVQFTVQHGEQRLDLRAPGAITIFPLGKRLFARVVTPNATTRTYPPKGARLTPLLQDAVVEVCGYRGDWLKLRLGPDARAWVHRNDLQFIEQTVFPSALPVSLIHTQLADRAFDVRIPLNRCLPYDVTLHRDVIRLRLYGAVSACDFVRYPAGVLAQGLREITWQQVNPEVMEVQIALDSPLMGFHPSYDAERSAFVFGIRTVRSLQEGPWVIALDPGHGGEERGAMAPDGTPEKDLNLSIALQLQRQLSRVPNLSVVLTRTDDTRVSLADRVTRAQETGAHLLLSLHHNALPDGRDPWAEQGVSTYYYHPFAQPLARTLQQALAEGTGFADYGMLYDSLHMCRIGAMPALLVELGFLTHPEDAERCLDAEHQARVVQALGAAIQRCLESLGASGLASAPASACRLPVPPALHP